MPLATTRLAVAPDAIAHDGSEVRLLSATARGSMAHFTLPPGAISKAIRHRSVEEVWFVTGGRGRMWRRLGDEEGVTDLVPGVSLAIQPGTWFQFRCDGAEPLTIVGVTMPPWPGADEAVFVAGVW